MNSQILVIINNFIKNRLLELVKYNQISFQVEVPDYQSLNKQEICHKFPSILFKYLLKYNCSIETIPTKHNNSCYFKKRKVEKSKILFSYHSINNNYKNIREWKEGYLPNMITFDKKGYSGWSSLCDKNIDKLLEKISQKKANKFFDKFSYSYINENKSKYKQPKSDNFTFPKEDFIFFPLQTVNDSVIDHSYFDFIKLVKNIVTILNKQNVTLVIKQHPRCYNQKLKKILEKYKERKNILLYSGSIHEAISKAKTIYTINSGVGFETLLHLKPIITFGKSDYMSMTKNIKTLNIIKQSPFYHLDEMKKQDIKKFVYYYIRKTSLFVDDTKNLNKIVSKFIKNYINKKEDL
jgi:hypothetical protein